MILTFIHQTINITNHSGDDVNTAAKRIEIVSPIGDEKAITMAAISNTTFTSFILHLDITNNTIFRNTII